MAHLTLVASSTPKHPKTDTRLIKVCGQYLLLLTHLADLRKKHARAVVLTGKILRDQPTDPEAADLWRRCWNTTPASYLGRGVEYNERKLAELLTEIVQTPAHTEAGFRARMQVWRTILAADDADLLLDSIAADFRKRRRV